jgi:hypothetical protein
LKSNPQPSISSLVNVIGKGCAPLKADDAFFQSMISGHSGLATSLLDRGTSVVLPKADIRPR